MVAVVHTASIVVTSFVVRVACWLAIAVQARVAYTQFEPQPPPTVYGGAVGGGWMTLGFPFARAAPGTPPL